MSGDTPPQRTEELLVGRCSSCGDDRDDLREVRRLYVTPEAWDTPGRVEADDDTERWCPVCRTHYPHQSPDAGPPG